MSSVRAGIRSLASRCAYAALSTLLLALGAGALAAGPTYLEAR